MKRLVPAMLLLAGCAATPPDAARIEVHAESGEARIVSIDGRRVVTAGVAHVPPGRRSLGIYCSYNLGIMIGDAQSVVREIAVDLEAGAQYRLEARMAPAPCTLALARENR